MLTELRLASRFLFRGRAKHISFIGIISCVGIALGIATLIVVISVMNGFDRELTERLTRFNYHVVIESFERPKLSRIEDTIKDWPEVEVVSLFLETQLFAKFDKTVFPLSVKGLELKSPAQREVFYKYVKEEFNDEGFFVGEGAMRRFFLSEKIEFYPLDKNLKLKEAGIRGVFKIGLYDIDNNYLVTSLEEARKLSPNYLLFLGVNIKDMFSASEFKKKVLMNFPEDVFVTTWIESNRVFFSALKLEKLTMFIILSLIILVASFNIFATLTVKVVEKTKDIGVLKALGFTSRRIMAIFSFQGLILGLIGTLFGAFLGFGLCYVLGEYRFIKLPADIYYIDYIPVAINYRDIFLIASIGILLSYLFSLFPALKASRLDSSEALRYD
ncbi:MAG: FtsX-like permease family protein [Candidatus Omnitrophica bacterium]|nr:FtsX-like permease family protein [Candidatus Omnitrophota bacterium]MBD3269884.1 FtsX-like permease family protein [Candidatus Omnitrophota bacterium]